MKKVLFLTAANIAAMSASGHAFAQTAADPAQSTATTDQSDAAAPSTAATQATQDIIVSGSRLAKNGFQAPTPVTVETSEQLRESAPSLVDGLRQIPQLRGSTSASTPGLVAEAGPTTTSSFNLRSLGTQRTLVLIDGRRPMISGSTGVSDASLFPMLLVQRVDIVTGGASAAYGSDAVSGVVNFILDTKFKGLKLDMRQGISGQGDGPTRAIEAAIGLPFADGRGHFMLNGSYSSQDQVDGESRDWSRRHSAVIANPLNGQPGQPLSILRDNVTVPYAAFGGLAANIPGFTGPVTFNADGTPRPYVGGTENAGSAQVGGDGAAYAATISARNRTYNGYARADYDLSDHLKIFADGAYVQSKTSYDLVYPIIGVFQAPYTIQEDNAFLPAAIRNVLNAIPGNQSFTMSKIARNEGFNTTFSDIRTFSVSGGFVLDLFGNWKVDGYGQYGESRVRYGTANDSISDRVYLLSDAVRDGAGNIVCRSTLTNPGNGCVPINPFGEVPLTDAQRAYLKGDATAKVLTKQTEFALTARGDLFSTWAGPVSAAIGAEYRKLSSFTTVDPNSAAANFQISYPSAAGGRYNVKEVFGETLVPLARDTFFAKSLDLNAAVRYTDYSTSGGVTTWKVGATWEIVDGVRLRGTVSRDIRAPNINELFGGRSFVPATLLDPSFGNTAFFGIPVLGGSNPNLKPEKALTKTVGMVIQPRMLPGFGFSVDAYDLKLDGAIAALTAQSILDQCASGNAALCSLITRDGTSHLVSINAGLVNVQTAKVRGVDFDVNYSKRIGAGRASLRGVATYLDEYTFASPGSADLVQAGVVPRPKWQGNLSASYDVYGFGLYLQERMIGSSRRVQPPQTVDNNRVPATFYTDLTIRQEIPMAGRVKPELYLTINNLFDQAPRITATNGCLVAICSPTDTSLYDGLGRFFTVGFRLGL